MSSRHPWPFPAAASAPAATKDSKHNLTLRVMENAAELGCEGSQPRHQFACLLCQPALLAACLETAHVRRSTSVCSSQCSSRNRTQLGCSTDKQLHMQFACTAEHRANVLLGVPGRLTQVFITGIVRPHAFRSFTAVREPVSARKARQVRRMAAVLSVA